MTICPLIKKISNHCEAGKNESLRREGLTGTQLEVMIWLASRDGAITSQKDIGEYFGIKHSTTIHILKRLEEKHFIYRTVNHENARYRDVYLTEKGERKVEDVKEKRNSIEQLICHGISKREQEELIRLLNMVYSNLQNGAQHER